jgi:beta-barrel assembly-enhancing protease
MRIRRFKVAALVAATVALLTGCETMPQAGGASGGLGAISSVLGGGSGGGSRMGGALDVIQGVSTAFKDYSAEEQRAMGNDFASVLLGAAPLLKNEPVQRYVSQVGWWVAAQAEKPKDKDGKEIQFAWRFGVTESEAVNAYATPGGFVFITVGLMRQLKSEAELAGVLGHEIAHVTRGHYLSALKKGGFAQAAGGVIQARSGNSMVSSAVIGLAKDLYSKGLDQSDEFDADRQGVLYAARAGYAPIGLPTVLNMYAATGSSSNTAYEILFTTHPAPKDRLEKLQPFMTSKFSSTANVSNESRYESFKRQLPRPK